ncbi:hypothetical protein ACP4OV_013941 [Aristida adscensionis]
MDNSCRNRTPFRDITNNSRETETDETRHKREERNRKQREYRARKKAKANDPKLVVAGTSEPSNIMPINTADSTNNSTIILSTPLTPVTSSLWQHKKREREAEISQEQREGRNQKHCKSESYNPNAGSAGSSNQQFTQTAGGSCSNFVQQSVCGSYYSNISQIDKENVDPNDSNDWLHKYVNHVRRRCRPSYVTCSDHTGGSLATSNTTARGDSSTKDKLLIWRERYNNMDKSKKENLLRHKREYMREYRKRKAGCIESPIPTPGRVITQDEIIHVPPVQHRISEPSDNDIVFDSGLYEPTHPYPDIEAEDQGDTPHNCDIQSNGDEETRWLLGDEGDEFESYRVPVDGIDFHCTDDPYDYVYQDLPDRHHVLRNVPDCQYCGAKRFQFEPPGFCCRKGRIKIHIPDVPDELKRLFTSQIHDDAKYFRKHIRYFNSHFAFTSLGVTLDRRVSTAAGTGIYTFRVHGALYHRLDNLVPGSQGPRHLQLYFYDTDETLSHRARRSPDLDINLIRNILRILQDNPYVQTFQRVGSIPNLDDYVIELNTNITPDQRRYNAPTASQVAAIWLEGNDPQRSFDRSVIVYAKGDRPRYIRAYHGCYDPLAYPLFFPRGETGWNKFMPYNQPESETPASTNVELMKEDEAQDHNEFENHSDNEDDNDIQASDYISRLSEAAQSVANVELMEEEEAERTCNDYADHNEFENHSDNEGDNDIQAKDYSNRLIEAAQSVRFVTAREYYCFKLQVRKQLFNILLFGGRLFQQWAVDMYIKIESMRLDWYSNPEHQKRIRAELYQGVVDVISAGETRGSEVGKRIVLPRTFPGGDRDMQQRFLNAMALVQKFGKPDYFITMTCNPYWEEITTNLEPGQTPQDRPELVARVYRAKLHDMKDLLIKKKYFGQVSAYAHVTEFQKRGLPHEHILLIMKSGSKLTTPDGYDKVISAEIPDKDKYPVLHSLVIKHMLHGPCGALNRNCPCMVEGECRFHYPRQFCAATEQGKDSYPLYRRRDDGCRVKIRGAELDNRWVVPYNPGLLMRYNCHINVEACGSIKAVKYLYKYIYKGHDRASFSVDPAQSEGGVINEIRQYRDGRYISPPEAVYRIFGFALFGIYPSVLQLQLHLPNMQYITFDEFGNLEDVVNRPSSSMTTLTEYFKMNRVDSYARTLLYKDFLEHYRWIKGRKVWQIRQRRGQQIGRIVYAHPAEGERYFLRVLLNHVRGATSYEDLRTVDGVTYSTFREACENRGLIERDRSLDDCLREAATFQMPCALRRLFATILVFCEATNIRALWDEHKDSMSEDYCWENSNTKVVEEMVLRDIRDMVHSMGKDIRNYDLPELKDTGEFSKDIMREVREELSVGINQEHLEMYATLNEEQRAGYDEIIHHVLNNKSQVFFIDGPGGTGKTFLYKALLAKVRSEGLIAIATATSGIAASILPGGRTAHSRFKIPLKLAENSMCNFSKQSGTAEVLRRASLIIWDEVAMTKRQAVETLDRSLQDIMDCNLPFGGKVMVFGGDFRQVLPVVTRGTRAQITDATLQRSYLWENMKKIRLSRNMRAQSDPWFSDYLLRIGNGTEPTIGDDYVRLPDDIVISYTDTEDSINKLISDVFPSLEDNARSADYMSTRAILSTKNEHVDQLNSKMIDKFPGQEKVYHSFDSVDDDSHNLYPIDFLNSITPNGLPPHVLKLKINCPVILIRNLDPNSGLCNGTRLMVRGLQENAIDAEIVGGQHAGKRVFIPRIPMSPSDDNSLPFKFKRKQFPIRLSFAMTINKAQGQTIPNVGIYLPEPVFSHGQLYVALSRGVSKETTRILAKPNNDLDCTGKSTKNIVYKDVLDW